jgi:hypothetical protein
VAGAHRSPLRLSGGQTATRSSARRSTWTREECQHASSVIFWVHKAVSRGRGSSPMDSTSGELHQGIRLRLQEPAGTFSQTKKSRLKGYCCVVFSSSRRLKRGEGSKPSFLHNLSSPLHPPPRAGTAREPRGKHPRARRAACLLRLLPFSDDPGLGSCLS